MSGQVHDGDSLSWWSSDLHLLQEEDISKQLGVIFGEDEASQILNPTIKDKPHQLVLGPVVLKQGSEGAHTLWNSLRLLSKQKLVRQMTLDANNEYISRNMKNKNHSNISSARVQNYRQNFELMHRVALMNENRTRQLLQTVKLPSITAGSIDLISPRLYREAMQKSDKASLQPETPVKELVCSGDDTNKRVSADKNSDKSHSIQTVQSVAGKTELVKYLTEGDCSTKGQFNDRMKKLGIDSSIGISAPQSLYRKSMNSRLYPDTTNLRASSLPEKQVEIAKKTPHRKNLTKSSSWQPLSLSALVEYTNCIDAPGTGYFKAGRTSFWKPGTSSKEALLSEAK